MQLLDRIEPLFVRVMDGMFARVPQPSPSQDRLSKVTIFSHRGEHDNCKVIENSMAAFEKARLAGIGGIEFDIRWTRDLSPVVFHDADLQRIYHVAGKISDFSLAQLRADFPQVPTLEEVIAAFGGQLHLMIELKREHFPDPEGQRDCLLNLLSPLSAVQDFHLMSLTPEVFEIFSGLPAKAYLPIARINAGAMSMLSLNARFGGLTGHYALINKDMIQRHHRAAQKIGTGFIHSRNCLLREINRGVDWIFSNHAGWIQNLVNDLKGCDNM